MGKIDDSARLIIKITYNKLGNSKKVAALYNLPVSVVDQYLLGVDQGTLVGREVIRTEIGRKQAEKEGNTGWKASEKDKYKRRR